MKLQRLLFWIIYKIPDKAKIGCIGHHNGGQNKTLKNGQQEIIINEKEFRNQSAASNSKTEPKNSFVTFKLSKFSDSLFS